MSLTWERYADRRPEALADQEATAAGIEQRERRPVRDLPQA